MRKIKSLLKATLSIILALCLIFGCMAIAGAATKEAAELADIAKLKTKFLTPTDTDKDMYPSGAMMFPVTSAKMKMSTVYAIHVFRQGDTKGEASITLKSIDMTAEYGNDYRIYTTNNTLASPVPGKANPYYGMQNTPYIPYVTESKTQYLGGDNKEELQSIQELTSESNDEYMKYMPTACSLDLTFADGENDKCIYVETLKSSKVTDNKIFMLSLSSPDGCKIGNDILASFTIIETREKPKTYIGIEDTKIGPDSEMAYVKVRRKGNLGASSSFYFHTVSGSAKAEREYEAYARKLTFMPGISLLEIPVKLIKSSEKSGKYFSAEISQAVNAIITKDKGKVSFEKEAEDEKEHENNFQFINNTEASKYVKDSDDKLPVLTQDKSNKDIASSSASRDVTDTSGEYDEDLFYKSTKDRSIRYVDFSKFMATDYYIKHAVGISNKTKTYITLNSGTSDSYNRMSDIVSTGSYDFRGVKSMHICYDPQMNSVDGDYGACYIDTSSRVKANSGDGKGSWMSGLKDEGVGVRFGLSDVSSSYKKADFSLNSSVQKKDMNLYFAIHRKGLESYAKYSLRGDTDENISGIDEAKKNDTYLILQDYSVKILGPENVNMMVNGKSQSVTPAKQVMLSDPGNGAKKDMIDIMYRDESAGITWSNNIPGIILKGIYFCDKDNYSNHSELYTSDTIKSGTFNLTGDILSTYSSYINDNSIVIRPVFDIEPSNLYNETKSPQFGYTITKNSDNYTVTDKENNKVGVITWTKAIRSDGYYKGDEVAYTFTPASGCEALDFEYETRCADTYDGLASVQQLSTYTPADRVACIPLNDRYVSVTPKIYSRDVKTELKVMNRKNGIYTGKDDKDCETISQDGTTAYVNGYRDSSGKVVPFSSFTSGKILTFTSTADPGYVSHWTYTDAVTKAKKSYYGNVFYYVVQTVVDSTEYDGNTVSLTFDKIDSSDIRMCTVSGKVNVQKGTLVNGASYTDEYDAASSAMVLLDDYSAVSDYNGEFTFYSDSKSETQATVPVSHKVETHRVLVNYNGQNYVKDITLSDDNYYNNNYKVSVYLSYKTTGVRPIKITAHDKANSYYNETITLITAEPTQFDLYFENDEANGDIVTMVRWLITNAAGEEKSTIDIEVPDKEEMCHYANMMSELCVPGDKLYVQLLDGYIDSETKESVVKKSYGKYDTGYNFITTSLPESITYMPDIGMYSESSVIPQSNVASTGADKSEEERVKPVECIGPISPMFSIVGFKPIFTLQGDGGVDENGNELSAVQVGLTFGEVNNLCDKDSGWSKTTLSDKKKMMADTLKQFDKAYGADSVPAFGSGKALNLNTSVKVSFSAMFCLEADYYIDNDSGEWFFTRSSVIIGAGASVTINIPFVLLYLPCFVYFEFGADIAAYFDIYAEQNLTLKELSDRNKSRFGGTFIADFYVTIGAGIGVKGLIEAEGSLKNSFHLELDTPNEGFGKYTLRGQVGVQFLFLKHSWGGDLATATLFDTRKELSGTGAMLTDAMNERDIMKETRLGDMGIEKVNFTTSRKQLAVAGADEDGNETVVSTSDIKQEIKLCELGDNKYLIFYSAIKSGDEVPSAHYQLFDRNTKVATAPVKLTEEILADADIPGSKIDKTLISEYIKYIDGNVDAVDLGEDVLIVWNKCTNNDKSNISKIKSMVTLSVMYNKTDGHFHDLSKIDMQGPKEGIVFIKPKLIYNNQAKMAQIIMQGVDLTDITDDSSLESINNQPVILFTSTLNIASKDALWTKGESVFARETRITYYDLISYNDKIYIVYVATNKNGFTLEGLDGAKIDSRYVSEADFDTKNAMYVKEISYKDGDVDKTRILQLTDTDTVVANPHFLRVTNDDMDNVLLFFKSNGHYKYYDVNTLLSYGVYKEDSGIYRLAKSQMAPIQLFDDSVLKDQTVCDDFIVKYHRPSNSIYAFWTTIQGDQRQIWSSHYKITGVETKNEDTELDNEGEPKHDKDGNLIIKKLDTPIKEIYGGWSGKSLLTQGGVLDTQTGMYKDSFNVEIIDEDHIFAVFNAYDYKFYPFEGDKEHGEWKVNNLRLMAGIYDTAPKYELPTDADEIVFSNYYPKDNEPLVVTMRAKNTGVQSGKNVKFNLYLNDKLIDEQTIDTVSTNKWFDVKSDFVLPEGVDPTNCKFHYTISEDNEVKATSKDYSFVNRPRFKITNATVRPLHYYTEGRDKVRYYVTADVKNIGNKASEAGHVLKFIHSNENAINKACNDNDKDDTEACYTDYGNVKLPALDIGERYTARFISDEVPESVFDINPEKASADLQFLLVSKDDEAWKKLYADDKFTQLAVFSPGPTQIPKPRNVKEISLDKTMNVKAGFTKSVSYSLLPMESTYYNKVDFSIADSDIATVDKEGNIKGLRPGKTTLTLTVGKIKKSMEIQIDNPYGDVNMDKKTNVTDATATQQNLAKLLDDKSVDKINGDVNKDSKFTIIDATYIQMSLAHVSNIDGSLPYVNDNPKNPTR